MDLRTVITISSLLFLTAGQILPEPNTTKASVSQTNSTSSICSCPSAAPATDTTSSPTKPAPVLGLLRIRWTSECVGDVNLILNGSSSSPLSVCQGSDTNIQRLLRNVCENKKGCKGSPRWNKSAVSTNGYDITRGGPGVETSCNTLKVQCTVEVVPDVQGQLHAYKVVTALLCCVLLVLLLIRFTRPTVKALQKRLSDRRQNRWIGPTQSHSVSYHRGKTAVKNSDGEKRLSYPALERLAVSDSREPSSNRNSDYNF